VKEEEELPELSAAVNTTRPTRKAVVVARIDEWKEEVPDELLAVVNTMR